MRKTKAIAATVAAVAAAAAVAAPLAGCANQLGGLDLGALGTGQSSTINVGNSKSTEDADKANYKSVANADGTAEYVTVLYVGPDGDDGKSLDAARLIEALEASTIQWYQVIYGSDLGAGFTEEAHVYLGYDATYDEIQAARDELAAAGWDCLMMSPGDYEAYLSGEMTGNLYYNENTVYGPLAIG